MKKIIMFLFIIAAGKTLAQSTTSELVIDQENNLAMMDKAEPSERGDEVESRKAAKRSIEFRKDYYYHLIVATFPKRKLAHDYRNELRRQGFEAEIIEMAEDSFYVHIPCYKTKNINYDMLTMVRQDFSEAWYKWLDANKVGI